MKTSTAHPDKMHRRPLLLAVAAGLASLLIPASAHAALYAPAGINANLYVANAGLSTIEKFTPGGVGSVFANSGLFLPIGLAFDGAGNLYVANDNNNTIEKFTPGGVGSVFANSTNGISSSPVFLAFTDDAGVPLPLANTPEPATLAVGVLCLGAGMARRRRSARVAA